LPGVFNLFQKGMHSIGHEELPHLMRIMRMWECSVSVAFQDGHHNSVS
jgi:hypothetical protein